MIETRRGDGPILLAQPHAGTALPEAVAGRLNATGRALADTDWHVDRLYDGLLDDATVVRTSASRYVIDVNRSPDDESMYPGMNTTGLVPVTDFDGRPIYAAGQAPDADEIETRRRDYHAPYHAALREELARIRARHGLAILYDCHSIRSRVPYLFEGLLPVFNIGTFEGRSCAGAVANVVETACRASTEYDTVVNGRFKGGWTTRHYGDPGGGVHAIQMELAQRAYMDETPPWTYVPERAAALRAVLQQVLDGLESLALSGRLSG